ncbi:Protein F30F8.5 a [Aphelenchoides avenae]|nr:Protein F30F8.5 a [Aphelenchus avenae]
MKLLSKFPPNIPAEVAERHTMVSHKMSAVEAWVLNTINATLCQFDLGCQIFTPNDELVDIESAELFYWVVKKIHLSNLAKFYENEFKHIPPSNSCLQATIMRLSKIIAEDIEVSNQNSSAFLNGKHVD